MKRTLNNWISKYLQVILIIISLLVITPSSFAQEPNKDTQEPNSYSSDMRQYLPTVMNIIDLTVGHVEITQAVQTDTNSVTLVANRQTVVRVYAQTNTSHAEDNMYVSISAYQDGSELPDSPLVLGPGTIPVTWSRADINTSFNTFLPSTWLSGGVTLTVTVDPYDTIKENDNSNNTVTKSLNFTDVPNLDITVVPIRYTHTPTGKTYPAPSTSFIQAAFERFYPVDTVNVTVRSQYLYEADLDKYSAWANLLDIITTLKSNDGVSESRVYYGLIPLVDSNGYTWWDGGYAGLGWVGYREAIGLTDAYLMQFHYYVNGKDTATHEVGHNFNRRHAPCGDPSSPDPDFPYVSGIVGQYGFDLNAWQVIPTSYMDIMGYCDPNWISDYTYLGLLENQLVYGLKEITPQITDSLYVRASIANDDKIVLQPVYALPSSPDESPIESEFSLEILDANGEVVAAHLVAVHLAEGDDFQVQSIHATVPRPSRPFSSLRLTNNGSTVSERSLAQSSQFRTTQPSVYLDNSELILDWGMPQIPAMVRYTIDDGESWTTLGFDILEGELRMDPQSLPLGSLLFEIILADTTGSSLSTTWEHVP